MAIENVLIRVVGFVGIFSAAAFLHHVTQWAILIPISLAHYFIGFYYSKNQAIQALKNPRSLALLLGLVAVGIFFGVVYPFTVFFFFYFHHILTEAYTDSEISPHVSALRFFFEGFVVIALIPYDDWLKFNLPVFSVYAVCILFVVIAFLLRKAGPVGKKILAYNSVALLAVIFTRVTGLSDHLRITHIVLYHVIVWTILPVLSFKPEGRTRSMLVYWGITVTVMGVFLIWIFPQITSYNQAFGRFSKMFMFWGTMHIVLALALSKSNPKFVLKLFRP